MSFRRRIRHRPYAHGGHHEDGGQVIVPVPLEFTDTARPNCEVFI